MAHYIKTGEAASAPLRHAIQSASARHWVRTRNDVGPGQDFLILTKNEAMKLVVDSGVITRYQAGGTYSENIGDAVKVYDELNNTYNMRLAVSCYFSAPMFCLKGDWGRFVLAREAKPGEVLTFHRYINEDHGYYYVMKITSQLDPIQEDDRAKAVKHGLDPDGSSSEAASKRMRGDS